MYRPLADAPIPILPVTFGKKLTMGNVSLYHGDLVMWCKFRKTRNDPERLEEALLGEIGVVHQCGSDARIAEDRYSCGTLLEDIEPEHMKVVGNIFDAGIRMPDEEFYTPYIPPALSLPRIARQWIRSI